VPLHRGSTSLLLLYDIAGRHVALVVLHFLLQPSGSLSSLLPAFGYLSPEESVLQLLGCPRPR